MVSAKFSAGSRLGVCLCAVVFAGCFFVIPSAHGDIVNPSFEFYDPNGGPYFPTATDWIHENYAADVNYLLPIIEYTGPGQGNLSGWPEDIVNNGLAPIDGKRLLMLSTGHIGVPETTDYARALQEITAQNGDRVSGYYFFGTCDYNEGSTDYDDFSTISMIGHSKPNIVIIHKHVSDIGDHSSMAGWERFEYRFSAATAGTYDLSFMVGDVEDAKVNSYLGIDGLQYCDAPTSYGDFDYDCQSDNSDFAIFNQYWLTDCAGPSESWEGDPNDCYTWLNTGSPGDVDKDNIVDINDLGKMATGWLSGK